MLNLASATLTTLFMLLTEVTIGGQTYVGPKISETTDSVIRVINDVGPVLDTTSDDMSCGHGAAQLFATQSAAAKAGDAVQFDWTSGDDTNWPHNTYVFIRFCVLFIGADVYSINYVAV